MRGDANRNQVSFAPFGERAPVPGLIEACREAGWALASVAPEQRTLESVFKQLQEEHIAKQDEKTKPGREAA